MENIIVKEFDTSIVAHKDGICYYFPVYHNDGMIIQSPINGRYINVEQYKNNIQDFIVKYLKKQKREPLNYWSLYLDAKRYYGNISYKEFISDYLTDYMNSGYSDRLL